MGETRSSNERKNLVVKTLTIVVLILLAFLSSVIYIFAYPKTTVTLYDDETTNFDVISQFKVKKYSKLGDIAAYEKSGYTFLYWAYEDSSIFNPDAELDVDALSLYATYSRNSYTITYHVQVYNEDYEQEGYISNQEGYRTRTELFGETIYLPWGTTNGLENGTLLPELADRVGYHFAGWTTKVAEEEIITAADVHEPGSEFVVPAGDVDLYAYWEKNEYEIVTHTGNEYQMEADGLSPIKDSNGKFIIRNNRVESVKTLKYLDSLSLITDTFTASLDDRDSLVVDGTSIGDHNEYKFIGWYLDENFTIPADGDYTAKVKVVNGEEIPYLLYVDNYGAETIIDSVLSSDNKYQFHLYSKWERKSYTISFNNNHSGSNGKMDEITIYKYDDHYGKYYPHSIDLKEVTTDTYLNSNKGYQFFAWSTTAQPTDPDCVTYYQWKQEPIAYDSNGSIIESTPYYDDFTYRHEISESRTFYTLWSRIRSVTFYQKNGSNRFNGASFVVEGIAGEWFKLPDTAYIVDELGWTNNDYTYFAGWRVGSGTSGTPILEKIDGLDNKEYYWIFSSTSTTSVTICAYWESIEYSIEYYLNDGTDRKLATVYAPGGKKTYYSAAPSGEFARDNYIFDGWSATIYEDNTPKSAKITYTSANSFVPRGSERVIKYYASWTMNFTVDYDLGVADNSVTGTLPASTQYSKKGSELKMNVTIGTGTTLKRTGYTFKGWVLHNSDGSNNEDIIFKAGNSVVFNFEGINVTAEPSRIQGACYLSGNAAKQYPFYMDGTESYKVILYACWEAKQYEITIHDTVDSTTTKVQVKYGQDFDFTPYVNNDHVGKRFIGIAADNQGGPILYSPDKGMILAGSDIIGDLQFYARYETREIYITYMIKAADAGQSADMEYIPSYGYSGYANKPVLYNDKLNLPTPKATNENYKFSNWYYEGADGEQIPVASEDRLVYEGDNLTLWANFIQETYTMEFKFINPLNPTEITTLDKDGEGNPFTIVKGGSISSTVYDYVMEQLNTFVTSLSIKEYTLDELSNTYQGTTYKFVSGQLVNLMNYPAIGSTNLLTFVTIWSANEVKFVYNSSEEANAEKATGYHTGKNFESTDTIMLEDVTFDSLNDGQSVYMWYIINNAKTTSEKMPLDKGSYLVGFKGKFSSISDMRDYIVWKEENGRYVGTINIYAETQQIFTVEFYRFKDGALEKIKTDTPAYDEFDNIITLASSVEALDGFSANGMMFNGWVVYSSNGRVTSIGNNGLVSGGTLELDPSKFEDFKIFCYADISYVVDYDYVVESDGKFSTVDLRTDILPIIKTSTSDYRLNSSYNTLHLVNELAELPEGTLEGYETLGYEYYGYLIGGNVYSVKEIQTGFNLEITGNKITIICYIATTKTVTYTLGSTTNEKFTSSALMGKDAVTYTYVIGYDERPVAERVFSDATSYVDNALSEVTIKDIGVNKEGYLFSGWQQVKGGVVISDIYKKDNVIYLNENITFVTYFTSPESGTIQGVIKYYDQDGTTLLKSVDVMNGTDHIVLGSTGMGTYDSSIYYAIYSWKNDGAEYRFGEKFSVPLLINAGDTFSFVAVVKDKYTIAFETYTTEKPDVIVTFSDIENNLSLVPTLEDNIPFSHWKYTLEYEDGTTEDIRINYNDAIAFKKSDGITPVKYSCTAMLGGYNLHIIPVLNNKHVHTLYAVSLTSISINLYPVVGDEAEAKKETITIDYGASFASARDLLSDAMLALETSGRGIVEWTTDSTRTDIANYNEDEKDKLKDNIKNISKNGLNLYAVWQTKYTVTYAAADDTFGYKDITPESSYHFEGETVEVDTNIIKSIYYKGFNTVYFDNGTYIVYSGEGNDYYYVTGFTATYGESGSQTYLLTNGKVSFTMLGSDITLTPIAKTIIFQVKFMENAAETDDKELFTTYTTSVNSLDLSDFVAVRGNFKFLGWHTNPDATEPLTEDEVLALTNQNTVLFAVWASNVFISFSYNGVELFKIPLDKHGNLSATQVNYYMSMKESTPENGYLKLAVKEGDFYYVNNSTRAYEYNNRLFYLDNYSYGGAPYDTIADLCAQTFTKSSTVNLVFHDIYTLQYVYSDPTAEEPTTENLTTDYFTELGMVSSSGIIDFYFMSKPETVSHKYYEPYGWYDNALNYYAFSSSASEEVLSVLISLAEEYKVIISIGWTPKSFNIVLNYTETPYTEFKKFNDADAAKAGINWTNIAASQITDTQGAFISSTNPVSLQYSSGFVIQFANDIHENYILIGWSTTLYPLGYIGDENTTDIIFRQMNGQDYLSYSESLVLDEELLGDGTEVVLYPVYLTIPTHAIHVSATNGKFTYTLSTDNSLIDGFMQPVAVEETSSEFESKLFELYEYSILTVVPNKPVNDYYKFDTLSYSIGHYSDSTLVIRGTDDGSCTSFNDCHEEVEIVYVEKTITINTVLTYTKELKTLSDTSTIALSANSSSVTLSATNRTGSIEVSATASLSAIASISEYFNLKITSGSEPINIIENKIDIMSLLLNEEDIAELTFTLSPKTYKINLELQGGSITGIDYTSELFGDGTLLYDGASVEVYSDAFITIETPTLDMFVFNYWRINSTEQLTAITNYAVTHDLNITAYFIQNKYYANYFLAGASTPLKVSFTGGESLVVGKNGEELISDNTAIGFTHQGWTEKGVAYANNTTITNAEKRDYNFYQVVVGETITINYIYDATGAALAIRTVEYGKTFDIPELDDLTANSVEGMSLYGFATTTDTTDQERKLFILGKTGLDLTADLGYTIVDGSTPRVITLYAVYYLKYTYNITYNTTDVNDTEYYITAINVSNEVAASDLNYKLDTTTPNAPTEEQIFAGYTVAYKVGDVTTPVTGTYNAGETIVLIDPSKLGEDGTPVTEITYIFTPVFDTIEGATTIKLYITNPTDANNYDQDNSNDVNLSVSYTSGVSSVNASYYPIQTLLSNKFFVSSLPAYEYNKALQTAETVTWTIASNGKTLTTTNAELYAYKLLGYRLTYTYSGSPRTIDILFSEPEIGHSIAGGEDYELRPIWEDRYYVKYYGMDGLELVSKTEYYDQDTILTVEDVRSENGNYDRDGFVFVGYASTEQKEILQRTDFYAFDQEFMITADAGNYDFYPAFSKVYTINLATNDVTLSTAGGDPDNIQVERNTVTTYVGGPLVTLGDYFTVSYNGEGYSFGGFTVVKNKLANELDEGQIISEYTLNSAHLEDGELTIYVAWARASYTVTFKMGATYKNGALADSSDYTVKYFYNEEVDLEDTELLAKIEALNETCFMFTHFSYVAGDTQELSSVVVKGLTTIYANFKYTFSLVYHIGEAEYVSDDVLRIPEDGTQRGVVGSTVEGYDADSNLLLDGLAELYWSTSSNPNSVQPRFFDNNGIHEFATTDLEFANNEYKINLYLAGDTAKYIVNLHYFDSFADLNNSYDRLQLMETPDYSALDYKTVSAELEYGSTLLEFVYEADGSIATDASGFPLHTPTSPFNDQIKDRFSGVTYNYNGQEKTIDGFIDLFFMFYAKGYTASANVLVNNKTTIAMARQYGDPYYTVKTYEGANTYVNDLYLIYVPRTYSITATTYLVDEGVDVVNNSSLIYSTIDKITTDFSTEDKSLWFNNDSNKSGATMKDSITFIPTEESSNSNLGYNFIGVYSAEYDREGNIVKFIPLSANDWEKQSVTDPTYTIKQDNKIYIFYSERRVEVTVQFSSPDNKYDTLAVNVYLDGFEDEDRIEEMADGKGVVITALYGQVVDIINASPAPYIVSYVLINGSTRLEVDSLSYELITEDGSDLDSVTITIFFQIQLVDVYFYTNTESPLGGSLTGEIVSVNYKDAMGETQIASAASIETTFKYYKEDKLYYNYSVELPYGSTITSVLVRLNNYDVKQWKVNNGTPVTELNVVVGKETHLKVEFEARTIKVEFLTSNLKGEARATTLSTLTMYNIKYGSDIELPYVVVDEELYVSRAWIVNGTSYKWGETISVFSFGNEQLENDTFKIYADSVGKYYVVFSNETDTSFEVAEQYKTRNSLVVTENYVVMPGSVSTYKYINANDTANIVSEDRNITGETNVFVSSVDIPEELQYINDLTFGGWATKQATILFDTYIFDANHVTNETTHEIKLTVVNSGMVVLKYYITNPVGEDFNLATSASDTAYFNIPYIQVLYSTDGLISNFMEPISAVNSQFVQWGNFFMNNSEANLLDNYEFHGWSITRQNALNTPSSEYANIEDTSALIYRFTSGSSRTELTNNEKLDALQVLLDKEYYTFYTVWERKHTVTFDADNAEYTNGFNISGKYAEGEMILLPNNLDTSSAVYKDLIYGSRKWKGWEDTTKGIKKLFDESQGGIYTFIVVAQDLNLTPIWENGTSVIFNINFGSWREYFANTFAANNAGVSAQDILGTIGYPFIPENRFEYTAYSQETINGTNHITSYREGKFWSEGDIIEVYKFAPGVFSQEGIYYPYDTTGTTYFTLLGWFIDNDGDGVYNAARDTLLTETNAEGATILTLTASMVENGTLTLYALWEPKNVEVKFYYTQADAINEVDNRRYSGIDPVSGEVGYTVVYVPFGGKITSVPSYASSTTIYMYDGYNTTLKDYNNVKKMNVLTQEQIFYRFNYWAKQGGSNNFLNNVATPEAVANTISAPIMSDTNLYPTFHDQYVVEFRGTQGGVISSSITQYVIDDENIDIKESIESVIVLDIVDDIYYLDSTGTKQKLLNSGVVTNAVKFDVDTFKIVDDHYVYIYLNVNLKVKAYLPNYSTTTPTLTQLSTDYMITINQSYNPVSMFSITQGTLLEYGNPDFAGWYYGDIDDTDYYENYSGPAYRLDGDEIKKIVVTSDNSSGKIEYYLSLNGSDTKIKLIPTNGGLFICLYAHFVTTTTVSLPEEAFGFAELVYSEEETGYYTFANNNTSVRVKYYSAYNSNYAPKITVDLKYGYTISDVNLISEEFKTRFASADNVDATDILTNNFKANISKQTSNQQTENVDGGLDNNLKVKFEFVISNIQKANNLVFKLSVDYIKFNVTYAYKTAEAVIQYYSGGIYRSLESDANGLISSGELTFIDVNNYLYVGTYEASSTFTVKYTVTKSGDYTNIKFTNVPYGATLPIKASPVAYLAGTTIYGSLKYHFAYWTVSALGVASVEEKSVGVITDTNQTIKPVVFGATGLVKDYTITATMEQNEITNIKYQFVIPTTTSAIWKSLVSQLKDGSVDEYDSSIGYIITWNIDIASGIPNGFDGLKAGDDVTALFDLIHETYDRTFNDSIISSSSGSKITSLGVLLNYFWFNNSWDTFDKHLDAQVCFLDKTGGKNTLYVDGSGEVILYSKLSEAVIVTASHKTIDYLDGVSQLGVDRANIELSSAKFNGTSVSLTNNEDIHILSNSNTETISVKVPYGTEVEFTVRPDSANSSYNAYTILSWNLTGGNNDGVIGNGLSKLLNTKENTDQFITAERELRPEYKMEAHVVIETYAVNFKNDSGSTIKTVQVAYDKPLRDKGYVQYGYTLVELRDTTTLAPLFDLDSKYVDADTLTKSSITVFNHSVDNSAELFGEYQYLFYCWSKTSGGSAFTDVLREGSSNTYGTVNLYAVYHKNTAVAYTVLGSENTSTGSQQSVTEFVYYLPTVNDGNYFVDMFGNKYEDSLLLTNALADIKETNSAYSNGSLYVGTTVFSEATKTDLLSVDKVTTLRQILSSSKKTYNASNILQVYPEISYTLTVGHDGKFAGDNRREYSITTLGGAYSVVMMSNGNLKINNVIKVSGADSRCVVSPISDLEQQFAYWEVLSTSRVLEYNLANEAYVLAADKFVNTHFNLKLNVIENDDLGYGSVVVYKGSAGGTVAGFVNLPLFDSTPSKSYVANAGLAITNSTSITNRKIYAVISGYTIRIEDRTTATTSVIYTGVYSTSQSGIDKFWWDISYADSSNGYALIEVSGQSEIYLEDSNGPVYIKPVVANDATVVLEHGIYITNGSQELRDSFKPYITLSTTSATLAAGSRMISLDMDTLSSPLNEAILYFVPLNSTATTSSNMITVSQQLSSDLMLQLLRGTNNYRWQYKVGGTSNWRDYQDGSSLVNGGSTETIYFRMACDWKEYQVTFSIMDTFRDNATFSANTLNTEGSSFDISAGLASNNATVTSNYADDNGNTSKDTLTFTLLYQRDSITYDLTTETFTVKSSYGERSFTATISVGNMTGLFNQGWLDFNTVKNGSIVINSLVTNTTYNCSEFDKVSDNIFYNYETLEDRTNYILAAWVETAVTTTIAVDNDTYEDVVNGHGTIDVSVDNIKGANNPESITNAGVSHGIDKSKTTAYITLNGGVSTKVMLRGVKEDTNTKHKFVDFSYINKSNTTVRTSDNSASSETKTSWSTIIMGEIQTHNCSTGRGAHIHVLYDATATRSTFLAVDWFNNVRTTVTDDLYGGYTVATSSTSTKTTVTITDFWNQTYRTFNVVFNQNKTDTATNIYPVANYYIQNTVNQSVDPGAFKFDGDTVTVSSANRKVEGDKFVLTGVNAKRGYMLGLVGYVHTVVLDLAVQLFYANGSSTTVMGWKDEYVQRINRSLDSNNSMTLDGRNTLTISGLKYGDNLGLYYDITDTYMGMMLGVYNSSDKRLDRLFVQNNTAYTLKGMDFYSSISAIQISSALLAKNYFVAANDSPDVKEGKKDVIPDKIYETNFDGFLKTLTEDNYALVLRIQERTESRISFQMNLPYLSDITNISMRTTLADKGVLENGAVDYAVQNYATTSDFYINGGIIFNKLSKGENGNLRNEVSGEVRDVTRDAGDPQSVASNKNYMIIGRGMSVSVENNDLIFWDGNTRYGIIDITIPNMYSFVGWYVYNNNGMNVMVPGTDSVSGISYNVWTPKTNTKVGGADNKVSIDSDCTIYLVLKRNAITINFNNGTWWESHAKNVGNGNANYDVETMLKADYLKNSSNGFTNTTTYTYPGGLVAAIPSDISAVGNNNIFSTAASYLEPKTTISFLKSTNTLNEMIRSGIRITYADSDLMVRAQRVVDDISNNKASDTSTTTILSCGLSSFTKGTAVAIISATSNNTVFDVFMKDTNTWYMVGVPKGDACLSCGTGSTSCNVRKVTLYDNPVGYNPTAIGTFSFEADIITLLQSLAIATPEKEVKSVTMYISKNTTSRLYNGLYWGTSTLAAPTNSYSKISFTYNCPSEILAQASYSDTGRRAAVLTGFRINGVEYKHQKNGSSYSEQGVFNGLNLKSLVNCKGDISIYPIWEVLNVYKVRIIDSKETLGLVKEKWALEGRSLSYTADLGSYKITQSVSSSSATSSPTTFSTLKTGSYIFSGLTSISEISTGKFSTPTPYSNSTTKPDDFKSYGVLRVVNNSGTYTVVQNTDNSVVKDGKYSFTITPTQDMILGAIWLRQGYDVTYSYNGTMTNTASEDALKDKGTKGSDPASYLVKWDYLLEGTPIRIGEGFDLSKVSTTKFAAVTKPAGKGNKTTIEITDGLSIKEYFSGTSGSTAWQKNALKFYNEISGYNTDKAVIGYSLVHDHGHSTNSSGSMYSNADFTVTYGCDDSDHTEYRWMDWYCYFCNHEQDTDYSTAKTKRVEGRTYTYYSSTQCRTKIYCVRCGGAEKDKAFTGEYEEYNHSYKTTTKTAAKCTTDRVDETICKLCNSDKTYSTKTISKTALGHEEGTPVYKFITSSDCRDGYNKTITCARSGCGAELYNKNEDPFSKHEYDKDEDDFDNYKCGSSFTGYCQNELPDGSAKCSHSKKFTKSHRYDGTLIGIGWEEVDDPDPWHCSAKFRVITILCSQTYNGYYCAKKWNNGEQIRLMVGEKRDGIGNNQVDTLGSATLHNNNDLRFESWAPWSGNYYCSCGTDVTSETRWTIFGGSIVSESGEYNDVFRYKFALWYYNKDGSTYAVVPVSLDTSNGTYYSNGTIVLLPVTAMIPPYAKPQIVGYVPGVAVDSRYYPDPLRYNDYHINFANTLDLVYWLGAFGKNSTADAAYTYVSNGTYYAAIYWL